MVGSHERKFNESISSANVYKNLAFNDKKSKKDSTDFGYLKETTLLLKGLLYYLLPICFFGVLAMFFPSIYAFFPVQES